MQGSITTSVLLAIALVSFPAVRGGVGAADDPPSKAIEPDELELKVEGKELSINGRKVALPAGRNVLVGLLGQPTRVLKKANTLLIWDELGVFAYEEPEKGSVISVNAALDKLPGFDFWPQKTFKGKLNLDGAGVTSDTTIEAINRAKKGKLLVTEPIVRFSSVIEHGDVVVTILQAKEGEFAEGGRIAEFVIEVEWPTK